MKEEHGIPPGIKTRYLNYLNENNLRTTYEREAILAKICCAKQHYTINGLHKAMGGPHKISKSTIYNTLELFEKAGIIVKYNTGENAEYELKERTRDHVHLVCTKCGCMYEAKINPSLLTNSIDIPKSKFAPDYFSLYIYGRCSKCKS